MAERTVRCPDCGGRGWIARKTGYLKTVTGGYYPDRIARDHCFTCGASGIVARSEEFDFPCLRCGHSPHWHRLDDSLNVSPVDPTAEFRCLGIDFDGCAERCPDYDPPPGYAEWIEARTAQSGRADG